MSTGTVIIREALVVRGRGTVVVVHQDGPFPPARGPAAYYGHGGADLFFEVRAVESFQTNWGLGREHGLVVGSVPPEEFVPGTALLVTILPLPR